MSVLAYRFLAKTPLQSHLYIMVTLSIMDIFFHLMQIIYWVSFDCWYY